MSEAAIETASTSPEPFMRGRFSLYQEAGGGVHLAYQVDGEDETRHVPLPAAAMAAARQYAEGGGMFGMLRAAAKRS
jgi:hypothetical protein